MVKLIKGNLVVGPTLQCLSSAFSSIDLDELGVDDIGHTIDE